MKYILLIVIALLLVSCNKENRRSNKLMPYLDLNGREYTGVWEVTEITIDEEIVTISPSLIIDECEIYEDTCYGRWSYEGKESFFYWQFKDNGKSFIINRVEDLSFNPDFVSQADLQCYNYSGVYDVKKSKKRKMVFESSSTYGYPNQVVRIEIQTERE
jgi:hypothetical protein